MKNLPIFAAVVLLGLGPVAESAPIPTLDDCNVVWDSPSNNLNGTMPLGNGDIALNVWVQDGDLLFLIGKSDAWVPDVDHGGNLQLALQLMLLQSEPSPTGKLHLLPAWPKDRDVSFKLHAPGKTIVEAVYRGGKFESIKVTPASRRKDLIIPEAASSF